MKQDRTGAAPKSTSAHGTPANKMRPEKMLKVSLESARIGSAVVLHCEAPAVSASEAHTICNLISEALPSARRMVVDLGRVLTFDSGALGELVLVQLWAEAAGYTLTFAGPSQSVSSLLGATNMVSLFDLYSSVDDAIAALHEDEMQSA